MVKDLSKIRVDNTPGTFLKTSNTYDVRNEKVSFSFEHFNTDSVINNRIMYNSFYYNIESSRNAVSDFFKIAKELSKYKIGDIMSDVRLKRNLHLNRIDNDSHIERIETVLRDCYAYPQKAIEQFDKEYYEFQISDGKRVIWHKVDNVVCPLFIDCNHMICIDSSRDEKLKMGYLVKSSFSHFSEKELNIKDKEIVEYLEMIINEYENDKSISSDEIIETLKEIIK